MDEQNERGKYSKQRQDEDSLMDSNEQEQEKAGFDLPYEESEERKETVKDSAKTKKKERTPNVEDRHEMPIPTQRTLPKQTDEKKPLAPKKPQEKRVSDAASNVDWQRETQEKTKEKPIKKRKKQGAFRYAVVLSLLLFLALAICLLAISVGMKYVTEERIPTDETLPNPESTGKEKVVFVRPYDASSGLLTLPEIYARYSDAVVSIQTKGNGTLGVGSGFFVSEDGYIATVAHVVEGKEKILVITSEEKEYEASVVSANALTDLALLKIEGGGFPTVDFGASGELLTGERVIAIGTPASLEYAGSLCTGEISYSLRTVKIYDNSGGGLQKKMKLLQTNVPVNPGNSGCPLFDEYGRVVGIVTMKLGNEYVGLGFAIPADGAIEILRAMMRGETPSDDLLSLVSVSAPQLGVLGEKGTVDGILGVKIVRFSNNTCDAAIKLREGDLIIQLDGKPIGGVEEMTSRIQMKNPGESIPVTVLRGGQRLTFEVILEKS